MPVVGIDSTLVFQIGAIEPRPRPDSQGVFRTAGSDDDRGLLRQIHDVLREHHGAALLGEGDAFLRRAAAAGRVGEMRHDLGIGAYLMGDEFRFVEMAWPQVDLQIAAGEHVLQPVLASRAFRGLRGVLIPHGKLNAPLARFRKRPLQNGEIDEPRFVDGQKHLMAAALAFAQLRQRHAREQIQEGLVAIEPADREQEEYRDGTRAVFHVFPREGRGE